MEKRNQKQKGGLSLRREVLYGPALTFRAKLFALPLRGERNRVSWKKIGANGHQKAEIEGWVCSGGFDHGVQANRRTSTGF